MMQPSQIFTPESPANRLLFAKMHVAVADTQQQEFSYHLLMHFMVETMAIARYNSLEEGGHIIGKLLKPHMQGTILINWLGRHTLVGVQVSSGDEIFSVGGDGALQIISNRLYDSNFDFPQTAFPKALADRGFTRDESDGLNTFYYRTDGFRLWDILHRYVEEVVEKGYATDDDVAKDVKLAKFASLVSDPTKGNIPGFPTKCMPMDDGQDLTQEWIYDALPPLWLAKETYAVGNTLSQPSLCNLLMLDTFKTEFPDIHDRLQKDLQKVSEDISARKNTDYNYLDPARVPCSIDM